MEPAKPCEKAPNNAWIVTKFVLKIIGMLILAGYMIYPSVLYGMYFFVGV